MNFDNQNDNVKYVNMLDAFNIHKSVYAVVDLPFFKKLLSPRFQNTFIERIPIFNFTPHTVVIEFFESAQQGVSDEQLATYKSIVKNENQIAGVVIERLYLYYKSVYENYFHGMTLFYDYSSEIEDFLPKIVCGNELDENVRVNSIVIYPKSYGDGFAALRCSCSWDEEHGFGVLLKNLQVIKVGHDHDVSPPF